MLAKRSNAIKLPALASKKLLLSISEKILSSNKDKLCQAIIQTLELGADIKCHLNTIQIHRGG